MTINEKFQVLLENWESSELSLNDIFSKSQKTLLYFYPKDNTPGCTLENKDFSCLKWEFDKLWITLVWVSKDSIESHKKFKQNHSLDNILISDPELVLHKEFWAFWEKNNYWKIVMWVIRSTFLVDNNWKILCEWKGIKATWHAERLLKELK